MVSFPVLFIQLSLLVYLVVISLNPECMERKSKETIEQDTGTVEVRKWHY
jgi:hypothetical protein